ncbi:C2H2-type zinc finger transcription factor [Mucor lusitanicus]|uniref:C2H2-type zinc finger transcription factor n=1 Tax=Mucor lusitanicus CBS 277.49 TaxID=747725 RepID=A0A168K7Q5_MUCCL|nr:C2H2-type zinc finger transcription factor [Mucor lusitanicus CBS 277.49]
MLSITNSKGRQVSLLNDDTPKQQAQKKRYHCTEPGCQKSFTTSGHLARHHRIHTGEKNFHCLYPGCPSRFSRQDNMMQHYRTHMSSRSRHHHYHYQYYQQHPAQPPLECQYTYYTHERASPLYPLKHTGRRGWSSFSSSSTDSSSGSPPPPPPQYQPSMTLPPMNPSTTANKWIYQQPVSYYQQEYV